MKLEDMLKFSLGFMLKKPQSLIFFIPVFLLNIVFLIAGYFLLGDLMANPEGFENLVTSAISSGDIMNIFLAPQIQVLFGFSLLSGILGWILGSYASICVFKAAELEHRKEKWNAGEMLDKFVGILPGYLGLSIISSIITFAPTIPVIILVVLWLLESVSLIMFFILGFLLGILGLGLVIYFWIRLYVAPVKLIIEDKGIIESLRESWSITRGNIVRILSYNIIFGIIIMIISIVLSIPVIVIGFAEKFLIPMAPISSILGYLIGFYTTATGVVFSYMIYLSLIERKDENKP